MSSNIIDNVRVRGNQDRNTINKILAELQDLQSIDAEDEAVEKRMAVASPTRLKTNSIGQEGAPNEVLSNTRDLRNEPIQLEMPTTCQSYPHTITENGTITFPADSGLTKYGGGAQFTSGDYLTIDHISNSLWDLERTDAFSIALFFKTDFGGTSVAVCKNDNILGNPGFVISTFATNMIFSVANTVNTNEVRIRTTTVINDNAWHSVVMTYAGDSDADTMTAFVDGGVDEAVKVIDNLTSTIKNNVAGSVGAESDGGLPYSAGTNPSLAHVVLMKEQLTQSWASNFNNGHIDISSGNLIDYFPFVGHIENQPEATSSYCVSS